MKKIGVYIHIPFCKRKCYYCDFVSFQGCSETEHKDYINALKKEITLFFEKNKDVEISTIYIGGGTPSIIDSKYIVDILALINKEHAKEITIEVNPGAVNEEKLLDYKNAGINRVSIGLQSTNNELLKTIGRIHDYETFLETYKLVKKVGFNNINVDLMIGLPNQKISDIKHSLNEIIELNPNHISVYSLIMEEGTKLNRMYENNEIKLMDDEQEREMYWYVKNTLELNGYKHYEISNFAKEGFESQHNLDCWNQEEYIGFGLAAHSYMDNIRFSNITNLRRYATNCNQENFKDNKIIEEKQDDFEKQKEYMLIGLRKLDGVSINNFKLKFGENPIFVFRNELYKLSTEELVVVDDDSIRLTNKGLDLANIVWEEFI